MESFLTDLKKDVQCSLCDDTLNEPKILKCFHTFCKPCIKRYAELIEEANVFKCPKCSSEFSISSVDDLKPSLLHSRIIKVLAFVESEKVCSVSESHSPASWYCFDCNRSMCDECKKYHSEFILDHKVKRYEELMKEDIEFMSKSENSCTIHLNQRVELYCRDCNKVICQTCLKHHHNDHKTMSIQEFASIKKAGLSKHLEVLEDLSLDEQKKQEQEDIASTVVQDGERAKREVKTNTKKMIENLQENERELLRQIENNCEKAKRNLNIIHHIPAVKEYINNVMERGLASEMVNIQETEISEDFIFNPFSKNSRTIFVPNKGMMQQVNSGIGTIKTCCLTDHTKSTIQLKSSNQPTALRRSTIELTTKTSTGKSSVDESDIVDVKISPENNVRTEENFVRNGSTTEIIFLPIVQGELTAEVKVNGSEVSNSPLVMTVDPQEFFSTEFTMKDNKKRFDQQSGITVNKENGKFAVADSSAHCVHVFNTGRDLLLTYGSQGSGQGQLSGPEGLAFVNGTDLVIADNGNNRICIVNTRGTLVKTFGKYGIGEGEFNSPNGVHVDDGNIIVSDTGNHRVQVFTKDGDYQYQFGLTKQENFHPVSTVTHRGLFYVSDSCNHVIHVFEKKGNVPTRISTIGGKGSADGQLSTPWGLAIDNDHNLLVCDRGNKLIKKFTLDGRFVGESSNQLNNLRYIATTEQGQLYFTAQQLVYGSQFIF